MTERKRRPAKSCSSRRRRKQLSRESAVRAAEYRTIQTSAAAASARSARAPQYGARAATVIDPPCACAGAPCGRRSACARPCARPGKRRALSLAASPARRLRADRAKVLRVSDLEGLAHPLQVARGERQRRQHHRHRADAHEPHGERLGRVGVEPQRTRRAAVAEDDAQHLRPRQLNRAPRCNRSGKAHGCARQPDAPRVAQSDAKNRGEDASSCYFAAYACTCHQGGREA
eukprot:3541839-Pleurochrysis_carterae.AAC.9